MSVINQMLKDLEQRQQGSAGAAVYVAPARKQGWWMLLLTLLCGLALGILGWRTWIYWQQTRAMSVVSEPVAADVVARVAPSPMLAPVEPEPAEVAATLPQPRSAADEKGDEEPYTLSEPAFDEADEAGEGDEPMPSDEELQPDLHAELAAEQQALVEPPRKPGVLKIETVELSPQELAVLAERKATVAMARAT